MSLQIKILPPGNGSQRVVLAGRLDTHTYEDLDEALAPLLPRQLQSLVLDLAGTGIHQQRRHPFHLQGAQGPGRAWRQGAGGQPAGADPEGLRRGQGGADDEIFRSTAEADAYLDAMQRKVLQGDGDE